MNPDLIFVRDFINSEDSNEYFETIIKETPWRQDKIVVYGVEYDIPRLQAWYGDKTYIYSGLQLAPLPWTETLSKIRKLVEDKCECKFNSVLLNLYRNGDDSVGWHSDDEPELGVEPKIASISFGETRDFVLRNKKDNKIKENYSLSNGSLLYMFGKIQEEWQHTLPKRKNVHNKRLNLTFRYIS